MNKVYLIGNLTRDPEMRSTATGISVCNFSIAVNRRFKDAKTGKQETDFFNVIAWRQLADLCGKFLMKGKKVAVVGAIQTRTYEAQDGSKRSAFDIVADEVEFITPAGEAPGTKPAPSPAPDVAYTPADQGFTQVDDDELPF